MNISLATYRGALESQSIECPKNCRGIEYFGPSLADYLNGYAPEHEEDTIGSEIVISPYVLEDMEVTNMLTDLENAEDLTAKQILNEAANRARETMTKGHGGPFGAAIVYDGKLISVESNSVLKDHDPTAHAEVNAIRVAGEVLGTHDLTGCELYTTAYPCPMCLSAIIWSNIKKVHVSALPQDADAIGFRDEFMYKYLQHEDLDKEDLVEFTYEDRTIGTDLFDAYSKQSGQLY